MRKNRKTLYLNSTFIRGTQPRKSPDEGGQTGAPANPGMSGDNPGIPEGNSGTSTTTPGDSNNSGQQFDPTSFWTGSEGGSGGAPSGESAAAPTPSPAPSSTQQQPEGNNFAQQLQQQLDNMSFDSIFDDTIAGEINQGNYEGVNKRIQGVMGQVVRQALSMQLGILKPALQQFAEQMRQETNQTFTSRDNQDSLVTLFPAAKNPVMARTIQPIYDQALRNTRGNREQAVAQTKEMLRFMAGTSAGDLDLEVAPRGQGDHGYRPAGNINWLDELTQR